MSNRQKIVITLTIVLLLLAVAYIFRQSIIGYFFRPTNSTVTTVENSEDVVEAVATGLDTPWSIVVLPGGDLLVSERSGQMKRIGEQSGTYPVRGVRETSEGGLLGIALHPQFDENRLLYVYFTTSVNNELMNQVDQYRFENDQLSFVQTIVTGIPAASNHDGGAVKFGPDKKLYITTGDAAQERLAQDTSSLAGKILRLNDDGSTPSDNPYKNLVWSYGHRNPQGIAWDDKGQLWSVEHGPSGTASGRDELNKITKGGNFGWPEITGDETRSGMIAPVIQSGDSETWAPAGMAFQNGTLYFAGLRGQALYAAKINNDGGVALTKYFDGTYGRLRAVTTRDDELLISTSNHDGRGTPRADDDQIIKVVFNK